MCYTRILQIKMKNIWKNIYKNLFRHYKESNEDTEDNELTFSDVQVQGSVLSFNTADMGRINYNHIKDETLLCSLF